MSVEKMATLLNKLLTRTIEGTVDWEETTGSNSFRVAFANYIVRIRKLELTDSYGDESFDYRLEIVNDKNRIIETADSTELKPFVADSDAMMEELFNRARGKARGAEEALDDILGKLR